MTHLAAVAELDPVITQIAEFRDAVAAWDGVTTQAEAIGRVRELERLKAACAAAQARATATLEQLRHNEEAVRGVEKDKWGKGLGAEVGLARGESPARGSRRLNLAHALCKDLSRTLNALTVGKISEEHAHVVAQETSWLSAAHRKQVDALIADRLGTLGPRQLAGAVRAHAQQLDQIGAVKHLAKASSERRVSVRPAPDNMAYLTALVEMPQAVAMYAGLRRDAATMVGTGETADPADPTGQPRTRDQIMADMLVQRVTGQTTAPAVPAEIQVVMTEATLFGRDETPAWLTGHGPIPAPNAKHWLTNPDLQVFLRRVFTRPDSHQLVALESRARAFPEGLRRMIMLRDDVCRTPWCDAPIQHADHTEPVHEGGETTYENASGLCANCNQIKENNRWRHTAQQDGLEVTTPTGHSYFTATPPVVNGKPPGSHPPPEDDR
ncbi:HNH endonuclease signature motif containing protein [Enteractinococcus fodinae]|uniref:HNH nuclease domain-containing protein n=1 Tax=Enteractinococcus fodinae TaxID=684663 RepID=A0ABU2B4X5_9MICC|nr:DUF222 domain-containing protein [Enteractinococcus fodinae]MDR7348034.1 hypothetical protein [Enteractinococcus fodinae]